MDNSAYAKSEIEILEIQVEKKYEVVPLETPEFTAGLYDHFA